MSVFLGVPQEANLLTFGALEGPKMQLLGTLLEGLWGNGKTAISETPHGLQAGGRGPKGVSF